MYFKGDNLISFNKSPGFSMNSIGWNNDFIYLFFSCELSAEVSVALKNDVLQ